MPFKVKLETNFRPDERTLLHPGVYRIPEDMSEAMAELALGSGAVRVEDSEDAAKATASFREPATKQPAPENKGRGAAPENKSPMDNGDSSSDGTEPDAGSRKRAPRAKRPSGE